MYCILYTIIGLPICMLFLANIGGAMARFLKFSYSRICCMWCRARRKHSEFIMSPKETQIMPETKAIETGMILSIMDIKTLMCFFHRSIFTETREFATIVLWKLVINFGYRRRTVPV